MVPQQVHRAFSLSDICCLAELSSKETDFNIKPPTPCPALAATFRFAQTDIPAWPVCSRPEPLEVGDIWDHTGERKELFAGSPEPLWEMGLVRNRQPGEPLLTPDREKWEGWHQVTDSWQSSWACRVLKLLHGTRGVRACSHTQFTTALSFPCTPSSKAFNN